KRDATGRAETIAIEGERRRQVRGWEFKIVVGRALGWNVLKSSRFSVTRRGSSFVFRGSGFGHGLGLCQNGAHVMARRGATHSQILEHYFPGTRASGGEAKAKAQSRQAARLGGIDLELHDESRRDAMFIGEGRASRSSSVGAKCAVLDSKFRSNQPEHFA